HMGRLFGELRRRGEKTFEVTERANTEFLERVTGKLDSSAFYGGDCATARSYYFNQHAEAALLRPTSTVTAHREAVRFPLDDYAYGATTGSIRDRRGRVHAVVVRPRVDQVSPGHTGGFSEEPARRVDGDVVTPPRQPAAGSATWTFCPPASTPPSAASGPACSDLRLSQDGHRRPLMILGPSEKVPPVPCDLTQNRAYTRAEPTATIGARRKVSRHARNWGHGHKPTETVRSSDHRARCLRAAAAAVSRRRQSPAYLAYPSATGRTASQVPGPSPGRFLLSERRSCSEFPPES